VVHFAGALLRARDLGIKEKAPAALVKLFKLLDRHPDVLDEIKTG
jgi:hypothetical protein